MSSSNGVSAVYIHVIDDVISKVRDDFTSFGVGDAVLEDLQAIWEMKMMRCGAISEGTEGRAFPKAGAAVHDLNVPYQGLMEEYETPTAEMLFPPTPLHTPARTPFPGTGYQFNIPSVPEDLNPLEGNGVGIKTGKPSLYMAPSSSWMNQRLLGVDVNVALVDVGDDARREGSQQSEEFFMMPPGKRKRDDHASQLTSGGYIPQQDGSRGVATDSSHFRANSGSSILFGQDSTKKSANTQSRAAFFIPQQDGIHDEYENLLHFPGVTNEEYSTPAGNVELRASKHITETPRLTTLEIEDDGDEPPLNEDDDDDVDDFANGEEVPAPQHLVLAQFDKVTRTKNRWKCTFKDGIMHINGREVLFNKANGEFEF